MFARLMRDTEESEKKAMKCREDTIAELERNVLKYGFKMEYSTNSECPHVFKELGFFARDKDLFGYQRVTFFSSTQFTFETMRKNGWSWIPSDTRKHYEFLGAKIDDSDPSGLKAYMPEK